MKSHQVTQGVDRAPNRSLFNALGYTREELERALHEMLRYGNHIIVEKIGE